MFLFESRNSKISWKQQKLLRRCFCSNLETAKPLGNSKISGKKQNLAKQQNLSPNEIRTEKSLCLFPKKRTIRLPWYVEAALQGQLDFSKSDRTWLSGDALPTPILKGATLSSMIIIYTTSSTVLERLLHSCRVDDCRCPHSRGSDSDIDNIHCAWDAQHRWHRRQLSRRHHLQCQNVIYIHVV